MSAVVIKGTSAGAYDGVEVGLHEFLVEVHFIEVSSGLKDDVHVVEACNLVVGNEGRDHLGV